jgi:hypothetical protein
MRYVTVCLLALFALTAARGEEATDGPKRIFRDPLIENLVGDWTIDRQIRGKSVHNTLTAEWVLNHQFLQLHMKDVADPPAYEALVLIGYSYTDKRYVAHWCDTFGGKFSAIGYGKRNGDTIEFAFEYPEGPFFNTFTWAAATNSWTMRMENQIAAGKRELFAIDEARRR